MITSIWFFPAMVLTIFLTVTSTIVGYNFIKSQINEYRERKLKEKTVMDCFDNYMYWRPGDEIVVSVDDKHDELFTLITYHNEKVLVNPQNRPNQVKSIYPGAIKSNTTAQLRVDKQRADNFHEEIMPSLIEAHNQSESKQQFLEASNDIN